MIPSKVKHSLKATKSLLVLPLELVNIGQLLVNVHFLVVELTSFTEVFQFFENASSFCKIFKLERNCAVSFKDPVHWFKFAYVFTREVEK
jgi:hypothetical protein